MDETAHRAPAMERTISILLVGPPDSRRSTLRGILEPPQWEIREARTCEEAVGILNDRQIGVTICDADVQEGDWQALLCFLQTRDHPPNLIVSSRLADERLWAEVLNLGGYDVLAQPFDHREVLRVARMAWFAWSRGLPARAACA